MGAAAIAARIPLPRAARPRQRTGLRAGVRRARRPARRRLRTRRRRRHLDARVHARAPGRAARARPRSWSPRRDPQRGGLAVARRTRDSAARWSPLARSIAEDQAPSRHLRRARIRACVCRGDATTPRARRQRTPCERCFARPVTRTAWSIVDCGTELDHRRTPSSRNATPHHLDAAGDSDRAARAHATLLDSDVLPAPGAWREVLVATARSRSSAVTVRALRRLASQSLRPARAHRPRQRTREAASPRQPRAPCALSPGSLRRSGASREERTPRDRRSPGAAVACAVALVGVATIAALAVAAAGASDDARRALRFGFGWSRALTLRGCGHHAEQRALRRRHARVRWCVPAPRREGSGSRRWTARCAARPQRRRRRRRDRCVRHARDLRDRRHTCPSSSAALSLAGGAYVHARVHAVSAATLVAVASGLCPAARGRRDGRDLRLRLGRTTDESLAEVAAARDPARLAAGAHRPLGVHHHARLVAALAPAADGPAADLAAARHHAARGPHAVTAAHHALDQHRPSRRGRGDRNAGPRPDHASPTEPGSAEAARERSTAGSCASGATISPTPTASKRPSRASPARSASRWYERVWRGPEHLALEVHRLPDALDPLRDRRTALPRAGDPRPARGPLPRRRAARRRRTTRAGPSAWYG